MDGNAKIKVIKKGDKPPRRSDDEYIQSHELSLLHLLVRKYSQEAEKAVEKYRPRRAEAQ
jgi:hypothetical protein